MASPSSSLRIGVSTFHSTDRSTPFLESIAMISRSSTFSFLCFPHHLPRVRVLRNWTFHPLCFPTKDGLCVCQDSFFSIYSFFSFISICSMFSICSICSIVGQCFLSLLLQLLGGGELPCGSRCQRARTSTSFANHVRELGSPGVAGSGAPRVHVTHVVDGGGERLGRGGVT